MLVQWADWRAGVLAPWAFFSEPGSPADRLCRESFRETKKVVWLSKGNHADDRLRVSPSSVVMALFLWLTDKTLEWVLYDLILGWKR